jgi:hypothetical protein
MCRLLDWQRGARRFNHLALCVVHVFDQVRLPFEARAVSAGRRDAAPVKNASAMRANSIRPIKRKNLGETEPPGCRSLLPSCQKKGNYPVEKIADAI